MLKEKQLYQGDCSGFRLYSIKTVPASTSYQKDAGRLNYTHVHTLSIRHLHNVTIMIVSSPLVKYLHLNCVFAPTLLRDYVIGRLTSFVKLHHSPISCSRTFFSVSFMCLSFVFLI